MNCFKVKRAVAAPRATAGFSLIEMLAVLAVLSILLGFTFYLFDSIMEDEERTQCRLELKALRLSLDNYQRKHGNYPICEFGPPKGCSPSETLFLSLHGFHNERGKFQIPPYPSEVDESLFEVSLGDGKFDANKAPNRAKSSKSDFRKYLYKIFKHGVAFVDPWGTPYVYEFPRADGLTGYRLYSAGPDELTGEGHDADDLMD